MNENIQGEVIVITGASSGLGEAAARLLTAQGSRVAVGARRQERIQALARELTAAGGKAIAVTTDVTDRTQVQRLVDAAVEAFGRVDVMINNAGLMPQSLLEQLRIDEWDRTIDVNLKGTLTRLRPPTAAGVLQHRPRRYLTARSQASSSTVSRWSPGRDARATMLERRATRRVVVQ
jgi:NADP-dependent 3-hydroxy acid dehydrogenase YdfG